MYAQDLNDCERSIMDDVVEVDVFSLLKGNVLLLVVTTLVVGAAAFGVSYLLPNEYTATTSMYVLMRGENPNAGAAISQTELNSAQMVASDVVTILTSARVENDVASQMGLANLKAYKINVTNASTTRVITLSVTGRDPELAAQVANAIVKDTSDVAVEVMDLQSVNVIDEAKAPQSPSGPKHLLIGAVGAAVGFFLAFAFAFMREAMDTRVRDGEEASELVGVPVVGHFAAVE